MKVTGWMTDDRCQMMAIALKWSFRSGELKKNIISSCFSNFQIFKFSKIVRICKPFNAYHDILKLRHLHKKCSWEEKLAIFNNYMQLNLHQEITYGTKKKSFLRQVTSLKRFNSYENFHNRTRKRLPFNRVTMGKFDCTMYMYIFFLFYQSLQSPLVYFKTWLFTNRMGTYRGCEIIT